MKWSNLNRIKEATINLSYAYQFQTCFLIFRTVLWPSLPREWSLSNLWIWVYACRRPKGSKSVHQTKWHICAGPQDGSRDRTHLCRWSSGTLHVAKRVLPEGSITKSCHTEHTLPSRCTERQLHPSTRACHPNRRTLVTSRWSRSWIWLR